MGGRLTTHVLDTTQGRPAANMLIQIWRVEDDGDLTLLGAVCTDEHGRTDTPLLADEEMQIGRYELVFAVGEYFAEQGIPMDDPPFLDRVPIRFGISDPNTHYHIPLLTSPWAYSTYRGS